jgi:hypothetical protein
MSDLSYKEKNKMKPWIKRLSYFATGGAFIAAGFLVVKDVSAWWGAGMSIVGFAINAIGGFFVKPEQP